MGKLIELCLEITDRCILNCIHCSTNASRNLDNDEGLKYDEICSIISDFCSCGGSILEISGGEPTLHPSLFKIVDFAKSKNLEVRLYTAGVAYDNKLGPLKEGLLESFWHRLLIRSYLIFKDRSRYMIQSPRKQEVSKQFMKASSALRN